MARKLTAAEKEAAKQKKLSEAGISSAEWEEALTLLKQARGRVTRAKGGQRRYLEGVLESKYGYKNFSLAVPQSEGELRSRVKQAKQFMDPAHQTTTRKSWEALQASNVQKGAEKLRTRRHYEIEDEELAYILEEIDARRDVDFYAVMDQVQAEKNIAAAEEEDFDLEEAVKKALADKMSKADAIEKKLKTAKKRKRAEKREKKRKKVQKSVSKGGKKSTSKRKKSTKKSRKSKKRGK